MQKTCTHCGNPLESTTEENAFYAKMNVPEPVQCPDCRRQQRLMFRNFFQLHHRTCDLSGKKIISNTPVEKFGEPQDLVGGMLFLLSDMSSFITGIILPIDGGYSAFGGV